MSMEQPPTSSSLELDRTLGYYRDIFSGDESINLTDYAVGMEVGQSGWSAYWAVEQDTAGRYWLFPLFRIDPEPSDSSVHIRRETDGYHADFSNRVLGEHDHHYDFLEPAERVDEVLSSGKPYGLPLAEVTGPEYLRPGFFGRPRPQDPTFPGEASAN
jgi:hypothetical protein